MAANKFTNKSLRELEQEIAYFYDVQDVEAVSRHYMQAITDFEHGGNKAQVVASLRGAYGEVKKQKSLAFDADIAANYEYELISAQASKAPAQLIEDIMESLYQTIFDKNSSSIKLIAQLRTALYRYKILFVEQEIEISEADVKLLKAIDNRSKELLAELYFSLPP